MAQTPMQQAAAAKSQAAKDRIAAINKASVPVVVAPGTQYKGEGIAEYYYRNNPQRQSNAGTVTVAPGTQYKGQDIALAVQGQRDKAAADQAAKEAASKTAEDALIKKAGQMADIRYALESGGSIISEGVRAKLIKDYQDLGGTVTVTTSQSQPKQAAALPVFHEYVAADPGLYGWQKEAGAKEQAILKSGKTDILSNMGAWFWQTKETEYTLYQRPDYNIGLAKNALIYGGGAAAIALIPPPGDILIGSLALAAFGVMSVKNIQENIPSSAIDQKAEILDIGINLAFVAGAADIGGSFATAAKKTSFNIRMNQEEALIPKYDYVGEKIATVESIDFMRDTITFKTEERGILVIEQNTGAILAERQLTLKPNHGYDVLNQAPLEPQLELSSKMQGSQPQLVNPKFQITQYFESGGWSIKTFDRPIIRYPESAALPKETQLQFNEWATKPGPSKKVFFGKKGVYVTDGILESGEIYTDKPIRMYAEPISAILDTGLMFYNDWIGGEGGVKIKEPGTFTGETGPRLVQGPKDKGRVIVTPDINIKDFSDLGFSDINRPKEEQRSNTFLNLNLNLEQENLNDVWEDVGLKIAPRQDVKVSQDIRQELAQEDKVSLIPLFDLGSELRLRTHERPEKPEPNEPQLPPPEIGFFKPFDLGEGKKGKKKGYKIFIKSRGAWLPSLVLPQTFSKKAGLNVAERMTDRSSSSGFMLKEVFTDENVIDIAPYAERGYKFSGGFSGGIGIFSEKKRFRYDMPGERNKGGWL